MMQTAHQHDRQCGDRLAEGPRLGERRQRDLAQIEIQRAHHAAKRAGDRIDLDEVEADAVRGTVPSSAPHQGDLPRRCGGDWSSFAASLRAMRSNPPMPTELVTRSTNDGSWRPSPSDRCPRRSACGTSRSGPAAAARRHSVFDVNRPPMRRFSLHRHLAQLHQVGDAVEDRHAVRRRGCRHAPAAPSPRRPRRSPPRRPPRYWSARRD